MTTKVNITPGADVPTEIRTGYHNFLLTLNESNKTCVSLPVIHITRYSAIVELDNITTRMSVLMRHLTSTSKVREKTLSVWEMARLGFDGDFEMTMNRTG